MQFTEWLIGQCHRDDLVGDLARDVAVDRNWPSDGDLRSYTDYVERNSTIRKATRALRMARIEYRRSPYWEKKRSHHLQNGIQSDAFREE